MKEYGSSVQKLVDYIMTIDEEEKRTKYAFLMVELMKQIHPNMKDSTQDYSKKLWDDLFIMSNFKLDVQAPFPPPSPESLGKAPRKVSYNQHNLKFKHYGRNVELLILRAIAEEKLEDKKILVAYIARLMKGFYVTWNKDSVDDSVIWQNIKDMSENLLGTIVDELSLIMREMPITLRNIRIAIITTTGIITITGKITSEVITTIIETIIFEKNNLWHHLK